MIVVTFLILCQFISLNLPQIDFNSFYHDYRSPKDSLDIILASEYDHSNDLFLKKQEVFKQPETIEKMTFRRLKNTRDVKIEPPIYLSHPLKKGGKS